VIKKRLLNLAHNRRSEQKVQFYTLIFNYFQGCRAFSTASAVREHRNVGAKLPREARRFSAIC